MSQYKTLIIYTISNDQSKKSFEEELEKYGLERVGTQDIFALPLEEYRTKVQAFKAYLRAYVRKHLDSQDTCLLYTVRGITHERGTDPDRHAANQSDE